MADRNRELVPDNWSLIRERALIARLYHYYNDRFIVDYRLSHKQTLSLQQGKNYWFFVATADRVSSTLHEGFRFGHA